jgi:hypothetical protein
MYLWAVADSPLEQSIQLLPVAMLLLKRSSRPPHIRLACRRGGKHTNMCQDTDIKTPAAWKLSTAEACGASLL